MAVSTVLALVNDDGHVAKVAVTRQYRHELATAALLLDELGVDGWSAADMDPVAAIIAMSGYPDCRTCTTALPCGCPVQLAARSMCPHGGGALIDAAARRLGFVL